MNTLPCNFFFLNGEIGSIFNRKYCIISAEKVGKNFVQKTFFSEGVIVNLGMTTLYFQVMLIFVIWIHVLI